MWFCEICEKIVPENEVYEMPKMPAIPELGILTETPPHKIHRYKELRNIYNNPPDVIGCCLVEEEIWCGSVREPTQEEYFIYHTIGTNV